MSRHQHSPRDEQGSAAQGRREPGVDLERAAPQRLLGPHVAVAPAGDGVDEDGPGGLGAVALGFVFGGGALLRLGRSAEQEREETSEEGGHGREADTAVSGGLPCRPVPQDEASSTPGSAADDFLYHLYRGSELLLADQVHEAKGELEQALALQPQDAKGQDLLAGVYFRLGVYPRAIEIWQRLVAAYAKDTTLKVNLALSLLKTGQHREALGHLVDAVALNPDHDKAWGYLGVTYWRLEQYREARDAFLRGGQAAMARRMEAVLSASSAGTVAAPEPADEDDNGDRAAMRSAAEEAIEQFEAEQLPLAVATTATRSRAGAWRVAEPGEERLPQTKLARPPVPNVAAPTLEMRLADWTLAARDDAPLSVGGAGELFVSFVHDGYVRVEGLVAVRGELKMAPVRRRTRGRERDDLLGGDNAVMRLTGPVAAVVAPNLPGRFHDVALSDDHLFLREDAVWGFDGRLGYESGIVPGGGDPVPLLSLHGSGVVVLRLLRQPTGVAVDEDNPVSVEPSRLLGWSGRLLPSTRGKGTAPYGAAAPRLTFKGRGVVLLT